MDKKNYISRAAAQMGVAPSALRYWEAQGLLRIPRDGENKYRTLGIETMMDISEILFYRSLSVPLAEIREISRMGVKELGELLEKNQEKLKRQEEEIKSSLERIREMRETLGRICGLREKGMFPVWARFEELSRFSFSDGEAVKLYVYDSYQSVIALKGGRMEYGIFLPEKEGRPRLREADSRERRFITGLFRVEEEGGNHNLEEFVRAAREVGGEPGFFLGRYLTTAWDGKRYHYCEGFLEILEGEK